MFMINKPVQLAAHIIKVNRVAHFFLFLLIISLSCDSKHDEKGSTIFQLRPVQESYDTDLQIMTINNSEKKFFIHDSVLLDNNDIASASVVEFECRSVVEVNLTKSGGEKFYDITQKYIGRRLGMIVNEKLIAAPMVRAKITKGVLIIDGHFSQKEAQKIAQGIALKK